jgi:hypothetical protein
MTVTILVMIKIEICNKWFCKKTFSYVEASLVGARFVAIYKTTKMGGGVTTRDTPTILFFRAINYQHRKLSLFK